MAKEILKRDDNRVTVLGGITDDALQEIRNLLVDPTSGRLKVSAVISSGNIGITILTATGAVDNLNTVFTFVSNPASVVVNGASYRDGHGVSIVGATATLDSPVGTGGDIYGLA